MKKFLVLFLALLVSIPSFAQERGRRHHDGDRRHDSWRGASNGRHHYLHRSHGRQHGYSGHHHHRHGGFRSTWGHYGFYSRPSYVYLDRDIYGYGYSDYGYGGLSYGRSSHGSNGLWWGALAGAVIGHNSGDLRHSPWRGAALGATAGYLLGSIADHRVQQRETSTNRPVVEQSTASYQPASVAPAALAPTAAVTPSRSQPSSSMSAANSLFGR